MDIQVADRNVSILQPRAVMPRKPREKPMRLLCLGLSRTGTMSLVGGLTYLGYTPYHGSEGIADQVNGSLDFWNKAILAKLAGDPAPLKTAEDFDEALWRYDAVTDMPGVLFSEQLLTAYPDAKVIVTERSVDSWATSMLNTFYPVLYSCGMQIMKVLDTDFMGKYYIYGTGALKIWSGGDEHNIEKLKQGYTQHYARMKELVPKERLLEWHARDGWEPLCRFLGKDVPEGEFPNVNQPDWLRAAHKKILIFRALVVLGKSIMKASPLVAAGVAWWYFRGRASLS